MTNKNNTLLVTVGLPRSGKSTWSMEYSRVHDVPVVNTDAIRLALYGETFISSMEPYVWAIAKTMVQTLFLTGYDTVIIDATHTRKQWRQQWLSKKWNTEFVVFDTSKEVCIERAKKTNRDYLVSVIERQSNNFEKVEEYEGPIKVPKM